MASLFGHGLVGYTLLKVVKQKTSVLLLSFTILSAVLPDIDVLSFKFGYPYHHPLGHRGFTHSILFAVLWAIFMALIFGKQRKFLWFFVLFFATLSHGLLDAMTTGGMGVGFFIPFNQERFFLPWQFIKVSPLGVSRFFSNWGLQVIINELKYIALPCGVILLFLKIFKR